MKGSIEYYNVGRLWWNFHIKSSLSTVVMLLRRVEQKQYCEGDRMTYLSPLHVTRIHVAKNK